MFRRRYPTSALPQFYSDVTHATVIVIVVLVATVLGALHDIREQTIGNVYTAAIGYAAGRAGSVVHRTLSTKSGANGAPETNEDVTS